jgi:hypothetical protein
LSLLYAMGITGLFLLLPLLGPAQTAVVLNLEPVAVAAIAWVALGETLTPLQCVGALVVVVAVIAYQLRVRRGSGVSHPARGSLERGGGAPSQDGDPTAEAIVGAAIPGASKPGSHPHYVGPLLRRVRRPGHGPGIDGKASRRWKPTK